MIVTGDQPLVNVRAAEHGELTDLEFSYPLTPSIRRVLPNDAGGDVAVSASRRPPCRKPESRELGT